jgi:hypothetical protein
MRESRTYGFVRGAHSDMRPYRDPYWAVPYWAVLHPKSETRGA